MSKIKSIKPIAAGLGAVALASTFATTTVQADANPFATTELSSGYMLAGGHEGKCGEGKCGEGKCGGDKSKDEGKCGEGKCGEGKCGGDKSEGEGKCGEGKCGG